MKRTKREQKAEISEIESGFRSKSNQGKIESGFCVLLIYFVTLASIFAALT